MPRPLSLLRVDSTLKTVFTHVIRGALNPQLADNDSTDSPVYLSLTSSFSNIHLCEICISNNLKNVAVKQRSHRPWQRTVKRQLPMKEYMNAQICAFSASMFKHSYVAMQVSTSIFGLYVKKWTHIES